MSENSTSLTSTQIANFTNSAKIQLTDSQNSNIKINSSIEKYFNSPDISLSNNFNASKKYYHAENRDQILNRFKNYQLF